LLFARMCVHDDRNANIGRNASGNETVARVVITSVREEVLVPCLVASSQRSSVPIVGGWGRALYMRIYRNSHRVRMAPPPRGVTW